MLWLLNIHYDEEYTHIKVIYHFFSCQVKVLRKWLLSGWCWSMPLKIDNNLIFWLATKESEWIVEINEKRKGYLLLSENIVTISKVFFFLIKSYQLLTEFAVWVDICKIVPCKFPWPIFRYKWFPEGRLQMNATLSLQTLSNKARRDWEIHSWTTFTISFVVFIGRTNKLSFLLWSLLLSPGVFVLGFHLFP